MSKEGYYIWRHGLLEWWHDAEKWWCRSKDYRKNANKVTVISSRTSWEFAKELGGQLKACEVFQIFEVDDDQIQLRVKDRKGRVVVQKMLTIMS